MITLNAFCHPSTLVEGARYILRNPKDVNSGCEVVTLLAYDPCPALVILRDEHGHRQRWPRQDLFLVTDCCAPST